MKKMLIIPNNAVSVMVLSRLYASRHGLPYLFTSYRMCKTGLGLINKEKPKNEIDIVYQTRYNKRTRRRVVISCCVDNMTDSKVPKSTCSETTPSSGGGPRGDEPRPPGRRSSGETNRNLRGEEPRPPGRLTSGETNRNLRGDEPPGGRI